MEEKQNQIKIGLWTYTSLIVAIIILACSLVFGWYYLFIIKKELIVYFSQISHCHYQFHIITYFH